MVVCELYLTDFWTTYGQVTSLFGAGFAGGFSTHIMDRIKEGREEKRKNVNQ